MSNDERFYSRDGVFWNCWRVGWDGDLSLRFNLDWDRRVKMKKVAVILGGLALAGCGAGTVTTVTSIFDQIQQAAAALCGYRPTFDTIQGIITALGGPPIVSTVAGLFCTQAKALAAQQAPRAAVTVNGTSAINLGTVIINGKPVTITVLR